MHFEPFTWSKTILMETLTLLSTLPTLWSTLVATSAMPARREARSKSPCAFFNSSSARLRSSISARNSRVPRRTCRRSSPAHASASRRTAPNPPSTQTVCQAVHQEGLEITRTSAGERSSNLNERTARWLSTSAA